MSEMKNKNKGKKRSVLSGRKFRQGWYATVLTILFIAVVIVLNVVVTAAEDKWALRIDASANQLTAFSDKTYEVLDGIDQDVKVYLLFRNQTSNDLRVNLEEILAKFRARNEHISIDYIDPVSEPNRVNKYTDGSTTLAEGSIIVTNADETRVKTIKASELYNYSMDQSTYQYYITAFNGESKLTTALMYVTSEDTPNVYFLTGHNEYPSTYASTLTTYLADENYDVSDLTLGTGTELQPGDTIIIFAAQSDLTDDEYDELKTWMESGGRLLYVNDPQINMTTMTNMKALLDFYGIGFKDGIVVESETATNSWINNPATLIPTLDSESDITAPLASAGRVLLPTTGAIQEPEMPKSGFAYTKLLTSSSSSYLKSLSGGSETDLYTREDTDESGPFTLAVSVMRQQDVEDPSKDIRIVAINDLYTIVDTNYLNASVNLDFSMNAINWLVNREVSVYIRSKAIADTTLAIPDAGTLWTLTAIIVIVIPAIVLIAGIVVWVRRRRL